MSAEISGTLSDQYRIDELCDLFEGEWKRHLVDRIGNPSIDKHLAHYAGNNRHQLLVELIRIDMEYRLSCGEQLDLAQYCSRYPDDSSFIQRSFTPSITADLTGDDVTLIERYTSIDLIGVGSFARVYRGFDETLQRRVAIKVPLRSRIQGKEQLDHLIREARVLAGLHHPNIVEVYDVANTNCESVFIVSRYVEGENLAQRTKTQPLSHKAASELVAKIADALHHAHIQGTIHRDVKPANILLDTQGHPYLTDFGLALRDEDFGKADPQGGTIAYMSPEQARGEGHLVDGRSDIFSLGAVYYELLTGHRPFPATQRSQLLELIQNAEVKHPRELDETIPEELERICLKALAKKAKDRYATGSEMSDDLLAYLNGPQDSSPEREKPLGEPAIACVVPKGLRSFDREDADFFLELLPGPRDRHGLPESIRFWKSKLEAAKPEETFRIGLIYGPSGCGKSSFVNAGLLPRLTSGVRSLVVECTPLDTEECLLRALRTLFPDVPPNLSLVETMRRLRCGEWRGNQKLLIVLDQFEQWIHATNGELDGELINALRQCDGTAIQCLLLVRDDFWMPVTRFADALEVDLRKGHNMLAVDLFSVSHGKHVLIAFGRAFGTLPPSDSQLTREQHRFLDHAVQGLARDGRIICVRLAIFAEMMKGRRWTLGSLQELGGTSGLGVTYLNETFNSHAASPFLRLHQRCARTVLGALLPEAGSTIRGAMRSCSELQRIAGYEDKAEDFQRLMQVLDRESRLLVQTTRESTNPRITETSATQACEPHYQLAHDYLVPALRSWLTTEQRRTLRGRAELRLSDRADAWQARSENRQLPGFLEYIDIALLTKKTHWTPDQSQMMRAAGRFFAARAFALLIVLAIVLGVFIPAWQAVGVVENWLSDPPLATWEQVVDTGQFGRLVLDWRTARSDWEQARIQFAITAMNVNTASAETLSALFSEEVAPEEFLAAMSVTANRLTDDDRHRLEDALATCALDRDLSLEACFRAAVSIARLGSWRDALTESTTLYLIRQRQSTTRRWRNAFKSIPSVRKRMFQVLAEDQLDERARANAVDVLAAFALEEHDSRALVRLVADSDMLLFPIAFEHVTQLDGNKHFVQICLESLTARQSLSDRERRAQANAAIALCLLDDHAAQALQALSDLETWGGSGTDRTVTSYFLRNCDELLQDSTFLYEHLNAKDHSVRRIAALALGESAEPSQEFASLRTYAESETNSGVQSALEWACRQLDPSFQPPHHPFDTDRQWFTNPSGKKMIVLDQYQDAPLALSAKEVTQGEFEEFFPDFDAEGQYARYGTGHDYPAIGVSWFLAAAYCNWLSEREGLQPCYEIRCDGHPISAGSIPSELNRMGLDEDALSRLNITFHIPQDWNSRNGYRLPRATEWKQAALASATTNYAFGEFSLSNLREPLERSLLLEYAWYDPLQQKLKPVGSCKPNALGFFDMVGNAMEWCQGENTGSAVENEQPRPLRGGSFLSPPDIESMENEKPPGELNEKIGFRYVRRCLSR